MKFSIFRFDPEHDAKPYMQDFELELLPTEHMLLDVILRLKQQDPTLTLRKSCREGVCGSDAMNINGRNGLACIARVRDLIEPVVIRPLPGFAIIRDLVVDMTQFYKQYHSITPLPHRRRAAAGKGTAAIARRARPIERLVRVHPLRVLQQSMPFVLVEPRQVRRPGRSDPGLPFHRR